MSIEEFYERAPLPTPVDPFAARDVEAQLVKLLGQAGYPADAAPVKVRALLRQLAVGWGLTLPYSPPQDGRTAPFDGIEALEAMELRRRWRARPLDTYSYSEQVRYRDDDGRWVGATVGSWDPGEEVLWVYVHGAPSAISVTDPVRVQET